jgi:hypothetical protein
LSHASVVVAAASTPGKRSSGCDFVCCPHGLPRATTAELPAALENLKYLLEHLADQAKASGIYPRIDDKTFELTLNKEVT